jgi:hypothetical protein
LQTRIESEPEPKLVKVKAQAAVLVVDEDIDRVEPEVGVLPFGTSIRAAG